MRTVLTIMVIACIGVVVYSVATMIKTSKKKRTNNPTRKRR